MLEIQDGFYSEWMSSDVPAFKVPVLVSDLEFWIRVN